MFGAIRDKIDQHNLRRRQKLTDRLRKFTEASVTSPQTPPATPKPEAPAPSPAKYAFTYDPFTTLRGAL